MMIREQLELRETEILSPYASFSRESRGREREEEECDIRPVFQREAEAEDTGVFTAYGRSLSDETYPYAGGVTECKNDCQGTQTE